MVKNKIPEAQYVITNECPLAKKSKYCVVPQFTVKEPKDWKIKTQALQALYDNGVRVLKFLGGEPFCVPGIENIIEFSNKLEGLNYAITTNAVDQKKILGIVDRQGIKGVFVSLDSLNSYAHKAEAQELWGCSTLKSKMGIRLLLALKGKVEFLGANTIVHAGNLDQLPEILEFLTEIGATMNICPLIWGKINGNYVYRTSNKPKTSLGEKDRKRLEKAMKKLVKMKHQGYNLGCPDFYALNLAQYSIPRMSWRCGQIKELPILRIGPDLNLMICSDLRGKRISRFNVFDLQDKYDQILKAWKTDPQRLYCCSHPKGGCYWSNIVRGNANKGRGGSLRE
ncbi:MAG: radical SAM protein [Candidatus Shapirobacteria bacterium]